MQIILFHTLPRSGATGLISSLCSTLYSIPDISKSVYSQDLDMDGSVSAESKLDKDMIKDGDKYILALLKTHRLFNDSKEKHKTLSLYPCIQVNLFRAPFDVAVSTYFYHLNKWPLINPDEVRLIDYVGQWAHRNGNDPIFEKSQIPSFIDYARLSLSESDRYSEGIICLSYNEAKNRRLESITAILQRANADWLDRNRELITQSFNPFNIDSARKALGNTFVFKGEGEYINDPKIMANFSEPEILEVKQLFSEKFGDIVQTLNNKFHLDITCW